MVEIILFCVGAYAAAGVLCLVPFHRSLLPNLDESANGATWGFRILVSPGLVGLWPVMVWKWARLRNGLDAHGSPDGPLSSLNIRRSQSLIIKLLAITLPILVAAAIAARPAPPPPVELPTVADALE